LRIFGEDQASNKAYQEIDTYIQTILTLREYSVPISIPQSKSKINMIKYLLYLNVQGCLLQCIQKANELREFGNAKAKVTTDVRKRLILVSGDQQSVSECEQKVRNFLQRFERVPIYPTTTASQEQNIRMDTQSICTMCMRKFDSPYSLQQCGHTFCRSCLMNYFESYLDSTTTTDDLKLCCPFDKCDVACLIRDIVSVLGSEKTARLAVNAFKIHVRRSTNDLVQCWGDDCNQVIDTINISNFKCQLILFSPFLGVSSIKIFINLFL